MPMISIRKLLRAEESPQTCHYCKAPLDVGCACVMVYAALETDLDEVETEPSVICLDCGQQIGKAANSCPG